MDSCEGHLITVSVLTLVCAPALGRESKKPSQTLSSVEASGASVSSHQQKVCSVLTLLRECNMGKSLLVQNKNHSFQTCFLAHMFKKVHQLKG